MTIWIVKKDEIKKLSVNQVSVEEIGQKAWGLCFMPKAWTRPFFVVDKDFFLNVSQGSNNRVVQQYMERIVYTIRELNLGENLIIRSSGIKEGMSERGRYESKECNLNNLEQKLMELINILKCDSDLKKVGLPLIIQTYVNCNISGHISNERRFAKENRDFVVEYERKTAKNSFMNERKKIETLSVHLRNWRRKYDMEIYEKNPLLINYNLRETLKIACAFFYYSRKRVHIEFVGDQEKLFLVQCDFETENDEAVNPEEYDVTMFKGQKFIPQILRRISETDQGKYAKINNVFVYKAVGEVIPPLFLLDDVKTLRELKKGNITCQLQEDIKFMTKGSLVIRTDVANQNKAVAQFLKRSNELRCYKDAEEFLVNASRQLEKDGIKDYVFIFHNFIPAKISAFVNAKPKEAIVEMQTLWGLPEGLYYNAHDRIIVDTCKSEINCLEKDKFLVNKISSYKESFIAPDENGKWIVKKLKQPYDWRDTIVDDEIIKDIAYRARKISEYVGEELSIMWFVGIDKEYYKTSNLPWYHEKYDRNSYYYTNHSTFNTQYKKKYFYEKEMLIETEEDLEKLRIMDPREVGIVRIYPRNDELLRSKQFINEVGKICKEKKVNIFLEGAALAHSFYQLMRTGVTVLSSREVKEIENDNEIQFNKLVRDRIPEIIRKNGEYAKCVVIKDVGLIREIKNKIIEEAYEILGAISSDELMEELSDLEEICSALEKNYDILPRDKWQENSTDELKKVITFEGAVPEGYKQYRIAKCEGRSVLIAMERQKSNVQLDFIINGKLENIKQNNPLPYIEGNRKKILQGAFNLLQVNNSDQCKKILRELRELSGEILKQNGYTLAQFEQIREKKAENKGRFDKAYVLLKTSNEKSKDENGIELFDKEEPMDIFELPEISRVDVDTIRKDELLIRLKFPIYMRKNKWCLKRNKISAFFNGEGDFNITKKISGTEIQIEFNYEKSDYEQLEFDFNNRLRN